MDIKVGDKFKTTINDSGEIIGITGTHITYKYHEGEYKDREFRVTKDRFKECIEEKIVTMLSNSPEPTNTKDHEGQIYNPYTDTWSWF